MATTTTEQQTIFVLFAKLQFKIVTGYNRRDSNFGSCCDVTRKLLVLIIRPINWRRSVYEINVKRNKKWKLASRLHLYKRRLQPQLQLPIQRAREAAIQHIHLPLAQHPKIKWWRQLLLLLLLLLLMDGKYRISVNGLIEQRSIDQILRLSDVLSHIHHYCERNRRTQVKCALNLFYTRHGRSQNVPCLFLTLSIGPSPREWRWADIRVAATVAPSGLCCLIVDSEFGAAAKRWRQQRRPRCIQLCWAGTTWATVFRMHCSRCTMMEYGLSEGNNTPLSDFPASNVVRKANRVCEEKIFFATFCAFPLRLMDRNILSLTLCSDYSCILNKLNELTHATV